MTEARNNILKRIRRASNQAHEALPTTAQSLSYPPDYIKPGIHTDHVSRFCKQIELGGGSIEPVDSIQGVPELVINWLSRNELPLALRCAPELETLKYPDELAISYGNTRGNDLVSLTPVFCAVAETGSVVLISGNHSPTSLNFLPDVHFAIVYTDQILAHYEDAWAKLRTLDEMPRTVNFITGPSKTADVEQTIQIGAHGPRYFHVFLVSR